MNNLTADTEVFASDPSAGQRACIIFTGTRQDDLPGIYTDAHRAAIEAVLAELTAEGWILSQRRVFDAALKAF